MSDPYAALKLALEAAEANHKWHQDYDDHGGYPGSDLETTNVAAIAAARTALEAQPVAECLDNDSPWLICKPCAVKGQCAMAAPPQRQPLVRQRIKELFVEQFGESTWLAIGAYYIEGVRAAERAHGIGGGDAQL